MLNNYEMTDWLNSKEAENTVTIRSLSDLTPAEDWAVLKASECKEHATIPATLLRTGSHFAQIALENYLRNTWKDTIEIARGSGFTRAKYHLQIIILHPWYLKSQNQDPCTHEKSALLEALRFAANETPMNKIWNYNCLFSANKIFRENLPEAHTYFSVITALGFKFNGERGTYDAIKQFTRIPNFN